MYLSERQQGSGSLQRGQFASRIAFQTPVQESWTAHMYVNSKALRSMQRTYRNVAMVSVYCFQDYYAVAMGCPYLCGKQQTSAFPAEGLQECCHGQCVLLSGLLCRNHGLPILMQDIANLCFPCRGIIRMLSWSVCIAFRTPVQQPWAAHIYVVSSKGLCSLEKLANQLF